MKFHQKLRFFREEKGLTQEELAREVGVSAKTISRYERGDTKPRYDSNYLALAKALGIEKEILLSNEDSFVLSIKDKFGSSDANYASQLVNGMVGLMAGGDMSDEDKKAILDTLQEAYIIAKLENQKYRPKKYRLIEEDPEG